MQVETMIKYFQMRLTQVIETVKLNSMRKLLHETIFFNREAIPVEMDLANLRPVSDFARPTSENLIEIKPEMITGRTLLYPIKSRYLKAEHYLQEGYRGFAMVAGDSVSGDIWYSPYTNAKNGWTHPDEEWLKIKCGTGELYSFDMYVNPEKRGFNLAAALQNGALHELKKQGYSKAYGFFWADNVPALWVHRTLRWKELDRVVASRFIVSRKIMVRRKEGNA
jgi:GNAT superfamily N-acetyltransferase